MSQKEGPSKKKYIYFLQKGLYAFFWLVVFWAKKNMFLFGLLVCSSNSFCGLANRFPTKELT